MRLSRWTRTGVALVLVGTFFAVFSTPAWAGLAGVGLLVLLYAGINRLDEKDKQHLQAR